MPRWSRREHPPRVANQRRQLLDQVGGELQSYSGGDTMGMVSPICSRTMGMVSPICRRAVVPFGDAGTRPSARGAPGAAAHGGRRLLGVVADGAVHLLVRERLPPCRTSGNILAAAALGARVGVEDLLPGEVVSLETPKLSAFSRSSFPSCPIGVRRWK